jgi:hypothetical protein
MASVVRERTSIFLLKSISTLDKIISEIDVRLSSSAIVLSIMDIRVAKASI